MNTLYFARGRNFGRGVLFTFPTESNEIILAEYIHSKNIFTLKMLFESLQSMNKRNIQNAGMLVYFNNTSLLSLISPYRCVTYKTQVPPQELMDRLLLVTEMLPKIINDLMRQNENDCGFIEILVFELLHCVLLHLNLIMKQTNTSNVICFTWNLFKLLANVIEATTLVVLRVDKVEANHFKREFIFGIVKAMRTALQRASFLVEGEAEERQESPYAHFTEPFPEEIMERLRQCVMRLDVDDWYTRIHNWTLDGKIYFQFTTEFSQFSQSSLRGLAIDLDKIEQHIRHQLVRKSDTPPTNEEKAFVSLETSAAAGITATFNMIFHYNTLQSASTISSSESISSNIEESLDQIDISRETPLSTEESAVQNRIVAPFEAIDHINNPNQFIGETLRDSLSNPIISSSDSERPDGDVTSSDVAALDVDALQTETNYSAASKSPSNSAISRANVGEIQREGHSSTTNTSSSSSTSSPPLPGHQLSIIETPVLVSIASDSTYMHASGDTSATREHCSSEKAAVLVVTANHSG